MMVIMTNQSAFKEFSKYVSLSVLGLVCYSIYVLADTFFIANAIGPIGLAALNFAIVVFSVIQGFGLMIGIGGATRYTILKNKGDLAGAKAIFSHSLILGGILAIIFMTLGLFFSGAIAAALGADAVTLPLAVDYIRTILLFSPFQLLNNVLIAFVRNDGNPRLATAGMMIGSFFNILLDYVFLFPLAMGMFGAALATNLSMIISIFVMLFHFKGKKCGFTLKFANNNDAKSISHDTVSENNIPLNQSKTTTLSNKKIIELSQNNRIDHESKALKKPQLTLSHKELGKVITLGSSALISELAFAIALITFNLVILRLVGNMGVAAYGIVANITLVCLYVFSGVAQGMQPLVSRNYASHLLKSTRTLLKWGMITAALLGLTIYSLTNLFARPIILAFNNENDALLTYLVRNGFRLHFIGLIFAGINIVIAAYFAAINKARTALLLSLLRSCIVIIPLVLILSLRHEMTGVWMTFGLTEFIVLIISLFAIQKTKKT